MPKAKIQKEIKDSEDTPRSKTDNIFWCPEKTPTDKLKAGFDTAQHFPKKIKDEAIYYILTRLLKPNTTLNRLGSDSCDSWYGLKSDSKEFITKATEFDKRINLRVNYKFAFMLAWGWGYSLMGIGYNEGLNPTTLEEQPVMIKGIDYIHPISKRNVEKWDICEDIDSDNYGNPEIYYIKRKVAGMTKTEKVHYSRIIHITRPDFENTFKGESMFEPQYNLLLGYHNLSFGIPEAVFRNVSPPKFLKTPDYTLQFTDEQQKELFDKAVEEFNNFSPKNAFVMMPGYEPGVLDTSRGMQLREPINFVNDELGAAGISQMIMSGFPAGSITGSELNRDMHYEFIKNIQLNTHNVYLDKIYKIAIEAGEMPEAKYERIWNSIKVETETEKINRKNTKAMMQEREARAIKTMVEAGFNIEFLEDNGITRIVAIDKNGVRRELGNVNSVSIVETTGTDSYRDQRKNTKYDDLLEKTTVLSNTLENEFYEDTIEPFLKWEKDWRKQFKKIYYRNIKKGVEIKEKSGLLNTLLNRLSFKKEETYRCECLSCGKIIESKEHCRDIECLDCGGKMRRLERPGPGQEQRIDSEMEVLTALNKITIESPEFEFTLRHNFVKIYEAGGEAGTNLLIENDLAPIDIEFTIGDKKIVKWLNNQANLRYTKTKNEIDGKIKEGLVQILNKGIRVATPYELDFFYKQLDNSIVQAFRDYSRTPNKNLQAMIRTETQRFLNDGNLRSYEENDIEQVQFLAHSNSCTECLSYHGEIMTLAKAQGLIPLHPNCGCTWLPAVTGGGRTILPEELR